MEVRQRSALDRTRMAHLLLPQCTWALACDEPGRGKSGPPLARVGREFDNPPAQTSGEADLDAVPEVEARRRDLRFLLGHDPVPRPYGTQGASPEYPPLRLYMIPSSEAASRREFLHARISASEGSPVGGTVP